MLAADRLDSVISIHALREESDSTATSSICAQVMISIHALREESDNAAKPTHQSIYISIHALREESDYWTNGRHYANRSFQSTLSVRRATRLHRHLRPAYADFNPRSP